MKKKTKEEDMDSEEDKETDDEYDEEDNDPPKKDMKELVQEAINGIVDTKIAEIPIKDMITEAIQEAMKPLVNDMKTASEMAHTYNTKKAEDLTELLLKEPYEYGKDFLEGKSIEELQSVKDMFEQSKAYKDFVATQEDMNKPNKELFEAGKIEDFVDYGMWSHLYGGKK